MVQEGEAGMRHCLLVVEPDEGGAGNTMLPVEDMLQLARSVDRERIDSMLLAIGKDSISWALV